MSIGAGGMLRLSLALGLALGAHAASAQTAPGGNWTDPPARSATPSAAPPVSAAPTAVAPAKAAAPTTADGGTAAEGPVPARKTVSAGKTISASKAERPPSAVARQAPPHRRTREARRIRTPVVAEAPRVRSAAPRFAGRREAPRRVVAQAYAPRAFAPVPYPYAPLPVGRVAGPVDGERRPIFAEGDDRLRRIAAAQAAGYLVVRARSVQYPDGRNVRSDRPYDDADDGLD